MAIIFYSAIQFTKSKKYLEKIKSIVSSRIYSQTRFIPVTALYGYFYEEQSRVSHCKISISKPLTSSIYINFFPEVT